MWLERTTGILNFVSALLLLMAGWYIQSTFPLLVPTPVRFVLGVAMFWHLLTRARVLFHWNTGLLAALDSGANGAKYSLDIDG